MYIVRKAEVTDLPGIHQIQNIPFREKVFFHILPPVETFIDETLARINSGKEQLYVLEKDKVLDGFIQFLRKGEDWEALTWGKWLNTLVYACTTIAFDRLQLPKLVFSVRQDNKRVVHVYRQYDFRRTGQEEIVYRPQYFGYIRTTTLQYYELTAEEYHEKSELIRKHSMKLVFQ